MSKDFAALNRWAKALDDELSGKGAQQRLRIVGVKLRPEVGKAVQRTLGDNSMSGWRRGKPINIVGTSYDKSTHEVVIRPSKAGRGPMRVLEQGRNRGNAGGFAGPGVNRSTGETARTKAGSVRKVRAVKGKRWNGYTQPKGTWSDAAKNIEDKAPGVVHDVLVTYALKKTVGKG